jgi:hypothetical protein
MLPGFLKDRRGGVVPMFALAQSLTSNQARLTK